MWANSELSRWLIHLSFMSWAKNYVEVHFFLIATTDSTWVICGNISMVCSTWVRQFTGQRLRIAGNADNSRQDQSCYCGRQRILKAAAGRANCGQVKVFAPAVWLAASSSVGKRQLPARPFSAALHPASGWRQTRCRSCDTDGTRGKASAEGVRTAEAVEDLLPVAKIGSCQNGMVEFARHFRADLKKAPGGSS